VNIHHTKRHRLAALLCVVGFSTSAHAGSSLTTPALRWGDLDNAYVSCNVLNIGKRSATDVSIEIFNANAEVEVSRVIPELPPGTVRGEELYDPLKGRLYYCVVSGRGLSNRTSRVTLCNRDASTFTPTVCVTAP
jgi:hypothetical protein